MPKYFLEDHNLDGTPNDDKWAGLNTILQNWKKHVSMCAQDQQIRFYKSLGETLNYYMMTDTVLWDIVDVRPMSYPVHNFSILRNINNSLAMSNVSVQSCNNMLPMNYNNDLYEISNNYPNLSRIASEIMRYSEMVVLAMIEDIADVTWNIDTRRLSQEKIYENLSTILLNTSNVIKNYSGRDYANWALVSPDIAEIFQIQNGLDWCKASQKCDTAIGNCKYLGLFHGFMKIYVHYGLKNVALVGFKGLNGDSGMVWCPYQPIVPKYLYLQNTIQFWTRYGVHFVEPIRQSSISAKDYYSVINLIS